MLSGDSVEGLVTGPTADRSTGQWERGPVKGFVRGFLWGGLCTLIVGICLLYSLSMLGILGFTLIGIPEFQQALAWAWRNLGLSLVPFILTLVMFGLTLRRLQRRIQARRPLSDVAQLDHLCDIWTGLFFGIGVIWTAIGMRSALVHALGEPETTAMEGAFSLLRKLVDGGILIALSTTIFGGIGGYLMRVVKACLLGGELRRYYGEQAEAHDAAVIERLSLIESHLQRIGNSRRPGLPGGEHHESESMGDY